MQPEAEGSESARLSRAIVDRLVRQHPGARVIGRPLRQGTIAHVDGDYARALGTPGAAADLARGSLADSEILIRELESADCLVIGTPMHNYTVPSALKAWIDHGARNRTFTHIPTGKLGVLADRPVYVAVSSGGSFASEPARQPDFLTPYLTAILNTIGLRTIHFFSVQRGGGGDTLARQEPGQPSWSAISPPSTLEAGSVAHLRQRHIVGPRAAYRAGRHHPAASRNDHPSAHSCPIAEHQLGILSQRFDVTYAITDVAREQAIQERPGVPRGADHRHHRPERRGDRGHAQAGAGVLHGRRLRTVDAAAARARGIVMTNGVAPMTASLTTPWAC